MITITRNSGDTVYEGDSFAEAAAAILGDDGHDWDVRNDPTLGFEVWQTRRSVNACGGSGGLTFCQSVGWHDSEDKLFRAVVARAQDFGMWAEVQ